MQTVPGRPANIWDINRWNISGADEMPKGNLRKQKRPKGVMNMVSNAESGDRGTCQKPELASSFEKTVAPDS